MVQGVLDVFVIQLGRSKGEDGRSWVAWIVPVGEIVEGNEEAGGVACDAEDIVQTSRWFRGEESFGDTRDGVEDQRCQDKTFLPKRCLVILSAQELHRSESQ